MLGNSFGGMIARRLAHDFRHHVLGLAAIAGVLAADHADRDVPARTVLSENAQAFVKSAYLGLAAADRDVLERISEHDGLFAEPEDASPEPFTPPTLFIMRRQDQVVGYHDAWARIEHYSRGSLAVLDTAGHNVHLDRPAAVKALATDWLDRSLPQWHRPLELPVTG